MSIDIQPIDFASYQAAAHKIDRYPKTMLIPCHVMGLCGECGEVAEKIKKAIRDNGGVIDNAAVAKELGDVLWYLANIATDLGLKLEDVAQGNLDKLAARAANNKIAGSGDDR